MAEGADHTLEELEMEITCAVCHGFYQQAKLLPCNHYYCLTCIEKMAARSGGEPFQCPECRKETSLPEGGVAGLQPAFFVERIKDLHGKMARADGKVEAVCEQCAGGKSVAFCRQCAEFICGECARSHEKMKAFAGHVVVSLEDLKKGGAKNIPLKDAPLRKCAEHDKTLKLFCFTCEHLICRYCTIIDHREHKFGFVNKCAVESREVLRKSLVPLQKVQLNIAGAEEKLVSEEANVDRREQAVCRAIQQSFEHLKSLLEQRKTELVGKVGLLARAKKNALATQKEVFQASQKEIQIFAEFVERNAESTSDQDLMSVRMELQNRAEKEEKHHQQMSLELRTTAAGITCDLPHDIVSVLTTVLTGTSDLESCQIGMSIRLTVSGPTVSLEKVSADLKCLGDPSSSVKGVVVERETGIFGISITPRVRGRHYLTVKVREQVLQGFQVFVKYPPSQLGKSIHRAICCSGGPWGVAVTSTQQLVVTEGGVGRKIVLMTRDGKRLLSIQNDELKNPRGVAVDSDRAIYVTDSITRCLFKFAKHIGYICSEVGELQNPHSLKIIDNLVYVVDRPRHEIKVFTMDCKVERAFHTFECPCPGDLAQGPDGLLYVAGRGKIGVYRPDGVFRYHLKLSPSSLKFSEFVGICFYGSDHIIVTDCVNGVYVFNTVSGKCVGRVSSDVIPSPAGVAVDGDGYVYVCSFDHRCNELFIL